MDAFLGFCFSGKPSGACLIYEGRIVGSVSEERFSGIKNDLSFPVNSINWLLTLLPEDFNLCISYAGVIDFHDSLPAIQYKLNSLSVADDTEMQYNYWKQKLIKACSHETIDSYLLRARPDCRYFDDRAYKLLHSMSQKDAILYLLKRFVPLLPSEFSFEMHDHHKCHAAYASLFLPSKNNSLVLTLDGMGDGNNCSITQYRNGEEIVSSHSNRIYVGRIYSFTALLLGMKRNEHEYKLMGLAPYGDAKKALPLTEFLDSLYDFSYDIPRLLVDLNETYFTLQELCKGLRFDNIAAAIQEWVESFFVCWVNHLTEVYAPQHIAIGGGVAMNCKAIGSLLYDENLARSLETISVPPTPSDETNCIGAAVISYEKWSNRTLSAPRDFFLGPTPSQFEDYIQRHTDENITRSFGVPFDDYCARTISSESISKLLRSGAIVGICRGPAEFGARALGNRSLLADPSLPGIVESLNKSIKNRDFWMPFAPVISQKMFFQYLKKPLINGVYEFMSTTLNTTELGFELGRAGAHPYDRTMRAQLVPDDHPSLLPSILEYYSSKYGQAVLLNTSFNTHGSPIVSTETQAIDIFKSSNMGALVLESKMFVKRVFAELL